MVVRKHDECLMVIHSSQGADVEVGFAARVEMRQADQDWIEMRCQANVSTVFATLKSQCFSEDMILNLSLRPMCWTNGQPCRSSLHRLRRRCRGWIYGSMAASVSLTCGDQIFCGECHAWTYLFFGVQSFFSASPATFLFRGWGSCTKVHSCLWNSQSTQSTAPS